MIPTLRPDLFQIRGLPSHSLEGIRDGRHIQIFSGQCPIQAIK